MLFSFVTRGLLRGTVAIPGCDPGPIVCPEKGRTVDWIPLLCIQTWCLWWFVDGTNVACLFDFRVCYVYVLCSVRIAEKLTEVTKQRPKRDSTVTSQNNTCDIMDDFKYGTLNCINREPMNITIVPITAIYA